jgi:flavin reductase (DIM6/NTAB) family NADH-FMN oxidoreductase RutF/DNA-binding IclR family transcriptional regulator
MTEIAGAVFRRVLGHFPTGVAIITAIGLDGDPVGMAVGSFSSVSLDPPLVAFMPAKQSTSWPRIRAAGRFCANILGAQQESVCRAFAMSGGDKFAHIAWRVSAVTGSPILDGVLAWIDCRIAQSHDAGDHFIVIGEVQELAVEVPSPPLVFFQGGYGRFLSMSLSLLEADLGLQLATADAARHELEAVAGELGMNCIATSVVNQELVVLANAGPSRPFTLPVEVGQRFPFVAPLGTVIAAWAAPGARRAWMRHMDDAPIEAQERLAATLDAVRAEGYSVGRGHMWHDGAFWLASHSHPGSRADDSDSNGFLRMLRTLPADYEHPAASAEDWLTINVPVFAPTNDVVMMLTVTGPGSASGVRVIAERLKRASAAAGAAISRALSGGSDSRAEPARNSS